MANEKGKKIKIGQINGVDIKMCDHFMERQEKRSIEELYVFKAISLSWEHIKKQYNPGTYMAIKVDMASIYNCFDQVIEKTPNIIHSKCCNQSITRRNNQLYIDRLKKRSDNSIMFLVLDKEDRKSLTVVTSLITSRDPIVKRKTILFDLTQKETFR